MNLDLFVTSDTGLAHLAGGLGVRVWLPLPKAADWRWLLKREECPWYPTMRLFRQREFGNWDEVFARVRRRVEELMQTERAERGLLVPCVAAELIDRIAQLEAGLEREPDQIDVQRAHLDVGRLLRTYRGSVAESDELCHLRTELKSLHRSLGQIEDDIRECERVQSFGVRYCELNQAYWQRQEMRKEYGRRIDQCLRGQAAEKGGVRDHESAVQESI
jgi:hypothetical protein